MSEIRFQTMNDNQDERSADPFDKTILSRLNHLEFLGLALRNLVIEIIVVCNILHEDRKGIATYREKRI
jgi:hypothetical protein